MLYVQRKKCKLQTFVESNYKARKTTTAIDNLLDLRLLKANSSKIVSGFSYFIKIGYVAWQ